jgi:hypothetical protein
MFLELEGVFVLRFEDSRVAWPTEVRPASDLVVAGALYRCEGDVRLSGASYDFGLLYLCSGRTFVCLWAVGLLRSADGL